MILDSIENIGRYERLIPGIARVSALLREYSDRLPEQGRITLDGERMFVNVMHLDARMRSDVPLECHRDYIDIQIPLSADEEMGYVSVVRDSDISVPYDATGDIAFYGGGLPECYVNVRRGMFVVFFPGEGHAPGITENGVSKIVVKVKI